MNEMEKEESSPELSELVMSDNLRQTMIATAQLARTVGYIGIGSAAVYTVVQFVKGSYISGILALGVGIAINIFLLQFSRAMSHALLFDNQREFADSLSKLKIYFSITGWALIALLSLAVLFIFFIFLGLLLLRQPL